MHQPNLDAQRSAMRQLDFLVGTWIGTARLLRGPENFVDLEQSERAEYRLDGLLLLIEGIGRDRTTDAAVLQALAVMSYHDARQTYRMRAFNDGRWFETDVALLETGQGMSWGFAVGDIRTHSVLRIDKRGAWTEYAEMSVHSAPPKPLLELSVCRTPFA